MSGDVVAALDRHHLAIVSGLLTALCVLPYLRDIRRGSTRPQRASWFVFSALSLVAAISQFAHGDLAGAWLSTGAACGFTVVFVVSITHGEGGSSRRDRVSMAVAMAGVVLSVAVRQPLIALSAVIVAELSAISITARKATREPLSETIATWMIDGLAGVFAIAAVATPSPSQFVYPVHHVLVNGWVVAAIVVGRRRLDRIEQVDRAVLVGVGVGVGFGAVGAGYRRPTESVRQNTSGYTSPPVIHGS